LDKIERMTNRQRAAYEKAKKVAADAAAQMHEIAEECYAARVNLPHQNEQGLNVIHGCNVIMGDLHNMFEQMSRDLNRWVPKD